MAQFETRADFMNSLWDRFGSSSKSALERRIQEKLRKKQQDEELQQKLKLMELKSKLTPQSNPVTTSIRISPMSLSEKRKYQEILGKTPGSSKIIDEENNILPTTHEVIRDRFPLQENPNLLGNAKNFYAEIGNKLFPQRTTVFTPEFNASRREAATKLKDPYNVSKTITSKENIFNGRSKTIPGVGADLSEPESNFPNPDEYQEGTIIEDSDGTQFKIINGQWERL